MEVLYSIYIIAVVILLLGMSIFVHEFGHYILKHTPDILKHVSEHNIPEFNIQKEKELIINLMHTLSSEKNEGERIVDFEKRIKENISKLIDV